jgi:integrase
MPKKSPNLMLRGGTWYLRVAVPRSLQAIRKEQGLRSNREVWKTLETGDHRLAKARAVHVKAEVFRAFEDEALRFAQRATPTLAAIESVANDFARLVRASLTNETLLELPMASEAEAAVSEQQRLLDEMARLGNDGDQITKALVRYGELDFIASASEDHWEARRILHARLAEELAERDYRFVDRFILEAARARGYRIDYGSTQYRQLAHLMLKAWIAELDRADTGFGTGMDGLVDQDAALAAWHMPGETSAAPLQQLQMASVVAGSQDVRALFNTYLREKFPRLTPNAVLDRTRTVEQFIEIAGLLDVRAYRKVHITAYKTALLDYPINAGLNYPGKTMREVVMLAPKEAKRLAPKTVKSKLSMLGSFGRWLSENVDGVDDANFRTTAPVAKRPETAVREFSDEEVAKILNCRAFTGCESEKNQLAEGNYTIRDYRYWLPLLAAFTGCRLNELTQLRVADVCEIDGIWTLAITDEGDDQSLKTKSSKRLVPLHSALLSRGFIEHVRKIETIGHVDIFWDIPKKNGRRSDAAGKWFRKLLVRLGLKSAEQRGGIHRFRHAVVQKLRESGRSDAEIALVIGHETKLSTATTSGYGSSRQMIVQHRQSMIEQLHYEGVV